MASKVSKLIYIGLILAALLGLTVFLMWQKKIENAEAITNYWREFNNNSSARIDHDQWQGLLDDYLISDHPSGINRVDYEGIADDIEPLQDYIDHLSSLNPKHFNQDEQMAYWINLYNALTVQLISTHYPINSITQLGTNIVAFGPWDDYAVTVNEQHLSLNDIEHKILRPIWKDERIHFAVNCASLGCPNLQSEAFTSGNLNTLLNQAAYEYLTHERAVNFNGETGALILSSLFDWYSKDFGDNQQAVLTTLSRYLPRNTPQRRRLRNFTGDIHYAYDWGINDDQ